jgi:hypothetical protein
MPDAAAAQRAITAIRIKKKNNFTKSSFVTLLLVSQRLTYDAKVEKFIFLVIIHYYSTLSQIIVHFILRILFLLNFIFRCGLIMWVLLLR